MSRATDIHDVISKLSGGTVTPSQAATALGAGLGPEDVPEDQLGEYWKTLGPFLGRRHPHDIAALKVAAARSWGSSRLRQVLTTAFEALGPDEPVGNDPDALLEDFTSRPSFVWKLFERLLRKSAREALERDPAYSTADHPDEIDDLIDATCRAALLPFADIASSSSNAPELDPRDFEVAATILNAGYPDDFDRLDGEDLRYVLGEALANVLDVPRYLCEAPITELAHNVAVSARFVGQLVDAGELPRFRTEKELWLTVARFAPVMGHILSMVEALNTWWPDRELSSAYLHWLATGDVDPLEDTSKEPDPPHEND